MNEHSGSRSPDPGRQVKELFAVFKDRKHCPRLSDRVEGLQHIGICKVIVVVDVQDVLAFYLLPKAMAAGMTVVVVSSITIKVEPLLAGRQRIYDLPLTSADIGRWSVNDNQMFPV